MTKHAYPCLSYGTTLSKPTHGNRHTASSLTRTRGRGPGARAGVVGFLVLLRNTSKWNTSVAPHCCNRGRPQAPLLLLVLGPRRRTQRYSSIASATRRGRTACLRVAPQALFCLTTDATEGRRLLMKAASSSYFPSLPPSLHSWHHTTGPATYRSTRFPTRQSGRRVCQQRAKGQTQEIDRAAPDAALQAQLATASGQQLLS